eukprot:933065-Pyramimonas_sp.AAC.1
MWRGEKALVSIHRVPSQELQEAEPDSELADEHSKLVATGEARLHEVWRIARSGTAADAKFLQGTYSDPIAACGLSGEQVLKAALAVIDPRAAVCSADEAATLLSRP